MFKVLPQKSAQQRFARIFGVLLLALGLFCLATQAKLSKYYPDETSNSSTFKSTKASENRADKIVQFAVIESVAMSVGIDSTQLFLKVQSEPVYQVQTFLHPYPFRAPPA